MRSSLSTCIVFVSFSIRFGTLAHISAAKGEPIRPPPQQSPTTSTTNNAPTAVPQMAVFAGVLGLAAGLL